VRASDTVAEHGAGREPTAAAGRRVTSRNPCGS